MRPDRGKMTGKKTFKKGPLKVNQLRLYQTELIQVLIVVCKHVPVIFIFTCLNHFLITHLKTKYQQFSIFINPTTQPRSRVQALTSYGLSNLIFKPFFRLFS